MNLAAEYILGPPGRIREDEGSGSQREAFIRDFYVPDDTEIFVRQTIPANRDIADDKALTLTHHVTWSAAIQIPTTLIFA
jgi:hypothetical protein